MREVSNGLISDIHTGPVGGVRWAMPSWPPAAPWRRAAVVPSCPGRGARPDTSTAPQATTPGVVRAPEALMTLAHREGMAASFGLTPEVQFLRDRGPPQSVGEQGSLQPTPKAGVGSTPVRRARGEPPRGRKARAGFEPNRGESRAASLSAAGKKAHASPHSSGCAYMCVYTLPA